jgi:hypothetical protein
MRVAGTSSQLLPAAELQNFERTEMRIEKLTDVPAGKVAVRPDSIVFPPGCVLCGIEPTEDTSVTFTRTMCWGVIAAIESTPVTMPLCATHRDQYRSGSRKISLFQYVSFGVAIVCGAVAYFLAQDRANEKYLQYLIAIFVISILAAYLSIYFRARVLPIRLRPRNYDRIGSYGAYVFHFLNVSAAERFAKANEPEPEAR